MRVFFIFQHCVLKNNLQSHFIAMWAKSLHCFFKKYYNYCENFVLVDSNDALYGSDPKFLAEISKICSTLIEEILAHLKYLGDRGVRLKKCLNVFILCVTIFISQSVYFLFKHLHILNFNREKFYLFEMAWCKILINF